MDFNFSTRTLSEVDIKLRIERGMKLLDSKYPGWRSKVNVEKLNMSSPENCVLGQLYGDLFDGLDTLGVSICTWKAASYGFAIDVDETVESGLMNLCDRSPCLEALTRIWKQELQRSNSQ